MGFWTGAASGLLSGLGSLGSGLFNTLVGNKQSKDLMDYQYQLQQKAIDAQNFYNSPEQQMKRLASAGLSPNLVYGSGVDGNQSSAASPSIANVRGQMGNPLQDAAQQYYQARLADAQVKKSGQDIKESEAREALTNARVLGQLSDNKWKDATLDTRIEEAKQNLANKIADEALTWSRTRNEDNRLEQIWADTELLKSRKGLTDEQALTESVKRALYRSNIEVNDAKIRQMTSYIKFIDAGTTLRQNQGMIQMTEYEAKQAYLKWRKEHPNASLTFDMIKEVLGIGGQAAGIVGNFIP